MGTLEQPPETLQRFAAGELDAFETLFRQFQGEVYRWILRIVRDPAAAEDLTIDTFWRIHRAHARFDPTRSFAAWSRRIASNVAVDHLKTARSRNTHLDASLPVESIQDLSVGNPAIRRELRERTQLAFLQLPAKLRAVAVLALIEGLPHSEIAEALDISTAAVKSRLFRAVRMLRKKLGNLDTNHD